MPGLTNRADSRFQRPNWSCGGNHAKTGPFSITTSPHQGPSLDDKRLDRPLQDKTVPQIFQSFERLPQFALVGILHNAAAYSLYLAANLVLPYAAAYTISYTTGVLMSFVLNRRFVFRSERSALLTFIPFFLLHLSAYAIGVGLVSVGVEILGIPEWLAPLLASGILIVYMFFGARIVMGPSRA
jgi:putative flippase GtrA